MTAVAGAESSMNRSSQYGLEDFDFEELHAIRCRRAQSILKVTGVRGRSGAGGVIVACARVPKRGARAPRAVAEAASSVISSASRRVGQTDIVGFGVRDTRPRLY